METSDITKLATKGLTMADLADLMTERCKRLPAGVRARFTPDTETTQIGVSTLYPVEIDYLDQMASTYASSGTIPSVVGQKHYGELAVRLIQLLPQLKREPGAPSPQDPAAIGGCITALWLSIGYTVMVGMHRQGRAERFQINIVSGPADRAKRAGMSLPAGRNTG